MAASTIAVLKEEHHVSVSRQFLERHGNAGIGLKELYRKILVENLKDVTEPGMMQQVFGSQVNTTAKAPIMLQISTARDATQPLRPTAGADEEDVALNAALQKTTSHRLLRLVLTDGHAEIPAVELTTQKVFTSVPIPGEKLLIREGAEVASGMIILTDEHVVPLGGEVHQLKREFLTRRNRAEMYYSGGLEGVPKFRPLEIGLRSVAVGVGSGPDVRPALRGRGGAAAPQTALPHGDPRGCGRGKDRRATAGGSARGGRGGHHDPMQYPRCPQPLDAPPSPPHPEPPHGAPHHRHQYPPQPHHQHHEFQHQHHHHHHHHHHHEQRQQQQYVSHANLQHSYPVPLPQHQSFHQQQQLLPPPAQVGAPRSNQFVQPQHFPQPMYARKPSLTTSAPTSYSLPTHRQLPLPAHHDSLQHGLAPPQHHPQPPLPSGVDGRGDTLRYNQGHTSVEPVPVAVGRGGYITIGRGGTGPHRGRY